MTLHESHPNLDIIESHLIGRLPTPENDAVEEHLLACEHCLTMAEALDEQIAVIRTALTIQ